MKKKFYGTVLSVFITAFLIGCLSPQEHVRSSGRARDKIIKTAVVEFVERGDTGIKDVGLIVADLMVPALNNTGAFKVYERISLNKIIVEQELEMTGIIDDQTIAKVGKMHGVEAIVTGSVFKLGGFVSVAGRLIDTETAVIIDTAATQIHSWDIELLSSKVQDMAIELAIE